MAKNMTQDEGSSENRESTESVEKIPEDEGLVTTGSRGTFNSREYLRSFFTTYEILIATILGVVGGFISTLVPFDLLVKTWYPLMGGTQLISGHHVLWFVLAYGITRKRLSMFWTAMAQGLVAFLIGSQTGILEVFVCEYEAFFIAIALWFIEHTRERDTTFGWSIAAGLGNMTQVPFFWYLNKFMFTQPWTVFLLALMFAFVSGAIIAGILSKKIVVQLHASGLIP
jgi:ABC-type thiamin/hydroxymethylpyrimidine transport system permease subunit